MKFYIETYGCTSNFGNSQDAAEALEEKGHVPSSPEEADAVIVNTCAVTEKTERKILRRLNLLQGKRLVIAGCLSTALPESIRQITCQDRLGLLNRSSAEKIAYLFRHSVSPDPVISSECPPHAPKKAIDCRQDLCGIVNIATGCNGGCSYCIVRKARGKLTSRKPFPCTMDHPSQLGQKDYVLIVIPARPKIISGAEQTKKSVNIIEDLELFYHKLG